MRESRDVLTALEKNYPKADLADAKTLRTQVCGELAQRGDAQCAAEVSEMAKRTETRSAGSTSSSSQETRLRRG